MQFKEDEAESNEKKQIFSSQSSVIHYPPLDSGSGSAAQDFGNDSLKKERTTFESGHNVEHDIEKGQGADLNRNPSSIIPRKSRKGLLAQLVIGIPEIDDPLQYTPKTKAFIVFIIALAAVAGPMGYLFFYL
jgi:hypothetical protein